MSKTAETDPEVEAIREAIRAAAKRIAPRDLADHIRVSHQTVYGFIKAGSRVVPKRPQMDKLRQLRDDLARGWSPDGGNRDPGVDGGASASGPLAPPSDATLRELIAYWRGRVEEMRNHQRATAQNVAGMGASLDAMARMLDRIAEGMGGLLDSGLLPRPAGLAGDGVSPDAVVNAFASVARAGVMSGAPTPPVAPDSAAGTDRPARSGGRRAAG